MKRRRLGEIWIAANYIAAAALVMAGWLWLIFWAVDQMIWPPHSRRLIAAVRF